MAYPKVDTVHFVGSTYGLEFAPTATVESPDDGDECHAFVNLSDCQMVIGTGTEHRARLSLLHEILHVLDTELPGGRDLTENEIRRLSSCLLHFFDANPALARWLAEGK
ncbi:MAG TPA: hypothetical protein PLN64_00860 [Candidatus Bipolaricaulis anaerobius]|nr:hypothetical protein [Candidatus Bipolaricaulis anaerobius]